MRHSVSKLAATTMLLSVVGAVPARGQADASRTGFWGELSVGYGRLEWQEAAEGTPRNALFLGCAAGIAATPRLLVGFELGGWTLEASNLSDPSEGDGLMQAFLMAQYHWKSEPGLFVKWGGGYLSRWINEAGEDGGGGWGLTAGCGYDFRVHSRWTVAPVISFGYGQINDVESPPGSVHDESYLVVTFAVTARFR